MDPCRICLKPKPSDFLTNILTASFQYVSYRHIYSYFGTVLEEHREYPLVICRDCEYQMICAYKFKMKCLEAEIKISLIIQAKSQIDNLSNNDESSRLERIIELNTLSQPQEMEINLISSVPEILSIDNADERGDLNFASNATENVIELNDQFNYTNVGDSENAVIEYTSETLTNSYAVPKNEMSANSYDGLASLNIYPKCHIFIDNVPLEIPLNLNPLNIHEEQRDSWTKCSKCGEELTEVNCSSVNGGENEIICGPCREDFQLNSTENHPILSDNTEHNYNNENTTYLVPILEATFKDTGKTQKKIKQRVKKAQFPEKIRDKTYKQCEVCGIHIKSINIARHLELHQNKASNKKYSCHICGKTFTVKYYANDHIKRMHKKTNDDVDSEENFPKRKVKCNICKKEVWKYFWKRHMASHKNKQLENQSFICDICQKSFISRRTIRAHMITVHLKKKRYECLYCGEKFIHSLTRYRHINKHHLKKKVARCSLCSATFYHATSLVAHRRKFHPPSVTLKCHMCNSIFFDRRHLKKHIFKCI